MPDVKGKRAEYVPAVNWKAGLNAGYRDFKLTFQCSNLSDQFTDATNAEAGGVSGVNGILSPIPYLTSQQAGAGNGYPWRLL